MTKLEKAAKKFLKDRGWDNLKPSDLAKSVSIEAGELLELFQWTNPELDKVKADKEKVAVIKKELADVMLYAVYICVLLDLDMEKISLEKLAAASKKYPPSLFKKSGDKEPGTEDVYHRIKKSYRRKGLS